MKRLILTFAGVAFLAGIYFWPKQQEHKPLEPMKAVALEAEAELAEASRMLASVSPGEAEAVIAPSAAAPLSEEEKKSISTLMGFLSRADEVGKSPRALFDALAQAGLKPVAARDSNSYTGTLWTVRTDNALPGTRYFHAQLFGEGETHMQHISFEIRPGANSMHTAIELARQANPDLGQPEIERADYVLWKKKGGKVVSVKRLSSGELRDNAFNAHAPEDAGTIWVTSEDEPSHEVAQF